MDALLGKIAFSLTGKYSFDLLACFLKLKRAQSKYNL
jgi:hypothetical protein